MEEPAQGGRRRHRAAGEPSRPPYKPPLHRLIAEKQSWTEPIEDAARVQGFSGWHQRGYLPHFDAPGTIQFVTFRLHDALPAGRRGEWEFLLRTEDARERRRRLEACLDRGWGQCWLRSPAVATQAEAALRFFDGQRYRLHAWVIMPNHVHAVVEISHVPLSKVIQGWKQFSARAANALLGRCGRFWQREYWDTFMRDGAQLARAVRYTESNPVKAGFVRGTAEWPWSSARLRDVNGLLPGHDLRP